MPSIVCRSKIRAVSDHCSLSLGIQHHLVAGDSSSSVCRPKETRFPDNVDVLLTSNLVITLSGDLDGEVISAQEMYASELARNVVDYFQLNAEELGLNCVSRLKLDESSGALQFVLTSSRQYPADPELLPVHVVLVAVNLSFYWRTLDCFQAKHELANHPFNERLSLPYQAVLNNVLKRFVTWQLVKRYPLIFGPWRQQLDTDTAYFRDAAKSLIRMIRRSHSNDFRSKCIGLLKIIHARRIDAQRNAARSLSEYLGDDEERLVSGIADEDALCYALERIYRNGMSRPQFKGVACMPSTDRADDEDLACNQADYSQEPNEMHLPESLLWDEPVKDVLSPIIPPNPFVSSLLDFRSDGEDEFPLDSGLDHHQDILEEEDWSDRDRPTLESLDEFSFSGPSFKPELKIDPQATAVAVIQEMDFAMTSVLDMDGSDDETKYCSQEISQSENIDFDGLAFGTVFRLLDGHVVHNTSSSDQDSQEKVPYNLGMEDESKTCSLFPSISGLLSNRKADPGEETHRDGYYPYNPVVTKDDISISTPERTNELIFHEPVEKDDLELDFLTDSTYSDSDRMDITLIVNKLLENNGDSVDVVATPVSSGNFSSHQPITWPSQAEHKHERSLGPDGFEDGDEESLWDVEAGGDEPESCIGGNENFLMMDSDYLFPEALE